MVLFQNGVRQLRSPTKMAATVQFILVRGRDHQTQIWFSGFRGEDLNVIFYQNMPNLHNRYISAERKISKKNPNIC
jgi:hypothetical protein